MSSAVNAELAKITPQVRAAFSYLRAVHRAGARRYPLREVERHEVVDRRRAQPARCGGYIQSVKWSTSKAPSQRSAGGGRPRPGVRQRVRAESVFSRSSTGIPVERPPGSSRRPAGEVGANATTSSPLAAAAAASPCSEPRM